jgi:hypothetical protein
MKNKTTRKICLCVLFISPLFAGLVSARPHGPELPHGGDPGPGLSIGAFIGIVAPPGSIEIKLGPMSFRYDSGVFYKHTKHGYVVTPAPRGAVVPELPKGYYQVVVDGYVYYRYNEVYYRRVPDGYMVVEAPVIVETTAPATVNTSTVVSAPVLPELSVWLEDQELLLRDGEFFKNTPEGLVWVELPVGALTKELPENSTSIWFNEIEYFDVDGALFRKTPDGYKVVKAPWE